MNRRISTLCKYLLVTTIFFAATPVLSAVNDHPAFKFKSNKELANLKPVSKSQTPLSRVDQKPSVDELHYDEKHPHKDAILVDTASIDTSKLIPSKVISLDPNRPDLELPDPQITIAGKTYILSVVESILDPEEKVRYVTAKIIGLDEGRARFIIDDESREVVGNLVIEDEIYRVLPREINKNQQLVYKLKQKSPNVDQRIKSRLIAKATQSSVYRLERQLLKTEAIYKSKPKYFSETARRAGSTSSLIGEQIDRVNIGKILARDQSEVRNLLERLDVITSFKPEYDLVLQKVIGDKKYGYKVTFRQKINGIPIRKMGSKLKIDPDGNVTYLSTGFIDPKKADIKPSNLNKEQVLELAKKAAIQHVGKPDLTFITLERTPARLQYKIIDNEYTLTPYWEVTLYEVESDVGYFSVFVDGHSGRTKVDSAADYLTTQVQTDVCEHESGVSLPACEDVNIVIPLWPPITIISNVRDIIRESLIGQFICEFVGLCQDPQAKHPWEVINNMEDWLSENTDGICCSEVGGISDSIDVKINTTSTNGPFFDPKSNTANFPHPASLPPATYHPVQAQKFDDPVVHEVTHGIVRGVNDELSEAISDGDPWAKALNEGFADAMAVLYSEKFNPPGDTKVSEDIFKNQSDIRDISESKTFDDFVDSTAAGTAHQNGKIFGNFIYRLRQQGLSVDQAAKVLVWIASEVDPSAGLIIDKTDEKDIKDAIDRISDIDQAIGAILDIVWGQMNGYEDPPAGGGGSGTPLAPSYISGFFTWCSDGLSLYTLSWGSSPGAAGYRVYYSLNGATYMLGGWVYGTSSPAYNSVDAFVKVSACNSSGCSPLSASTFFQPHVCGG